MPRQCWEHSFGQLAFSPAHKNVCLCVSVSVFVPKINQSHTPAVISRLISQTLQTNFRKTREHFFSLRKQVNHGSSLSLHSFSGLYMQLQKSKGEKKVNPSEEGHVPLEHSNWTAAKGEKSL